MAHVIEKEQYFVFRTKDITSKGVIGNFVFPDSDTFDITVDVTLTRSHPCNNCLPEHLRIPSWLFPVSHGIFFRIQIPLPDPVPEMADIRFGNGSSPVPVNASLCSRCGLVHYPCCLSGNAAHGQGIPGDPLHNYKR